MRPLARIRATDLRSREFGVAFGAAGVNGKVARHSTQRAPRRRLGGFSGYGHVQIGPWVGPSIGMGQHLAVVGEQPRDVADGPRLEQLELQLRAIGRVGVLLTLRSVPGTPIPNPLFAKHHNKRDQEDAARRVVQVAACPVHPVRDRRSYNVARRSQCPLAFSGSSPATVELQLPNPIVGEITSLKAHGASCAKTLPTIAPIQQIQYFACDPLQTVPPNAPVAPTAIPRSFTRDIPLMSRLA